MLTGDNGILTRTTQAKEATRGGKVQETVTLAAANNAGVEHIGGTKQTKTDVITQLHNDGKLTDSEVATLEKSDEIVIGGITIDFSVLGGSNWEYDHTAQTVKKGSLELKIGDYVQDKDYLETDGTTIKKDSKGFDGKWRVLGVEDGQLLLVTDTYYAPFEEDATNGITRSSSGNFGPDLYGLQLSGKDGYDNGENRLNKIGEQYNNSKLEKGRSITVEDINKVTGYNPMEARMDASDLTKITPFAGGRTDQYQNNVTYTMKDGKVWYKGDPVKTTETQSSFTKFWLPGASSDITEPFTTKSTYYVYYPETYGPFPASAVTSGQTLPGMSNTSVAYDMLFKTPYAPYWLASPCVFAYSGYAFWNLFVVAGPGWVSLGDLWGSNDGSRSRASGVRPAVSLKSNITPNLVTQGNATTPAVYEI